MRARLACRALAFRLFLLQARRLRFALLEVMGRGVAIGLLARLPFEQVHERARVGSVKTVGIAAEEFLQRRIVGAGTDARPDRLVGLGLVQVIFGNHRDRQFRRLAPTRRGVDVGADAPEHRADLEPGLLDLLEERGRERAVAADPVLRHVVDLRRIDDYHPLRPLHRREPPSNRHVAGGEGDRANEPLRQRIVAARVENHDLNAWRKLHRRLHIVEADHLVAKADLVLELRVDRHEVVPAPILHAVAGVVEKHGVSPSSFARELGDRLVHLPLFDVDFQRHLESDRLQRLGDVCGIIRRIGEGRSILIGAVANDQRHALVGYARRRQTEKRKGGQAKDQQRSVLRLHAAVP